MRCGSARRPTPHDRIVLSAKVSNVQDLIDVYRLTGRALRVPAASRADRSRNGAAGVVASTAALVGAVAGRNRRHDSRLGHARSPGGDRREEVLVTSRHAAMAGAAQLHATGHGLPGMRSDDQHRLPGHGAATSRSICASGCRHGSESTQASKNSRVAVMGCVVNGPGESKRAEHRHLAAGHVRGTQSPGLRRRELGRRSRGDAIVPEFLEILESYVANRYSVRGER